LITKQLDEIAIRTARLTAEIEGRSTLEFPADIVRRSSAPHIAASIATEAALFKSRQTGREQQIAQLRERITQLRQQASGIEAQIAARSSELDLAGKERDALDALEGKNLVNIAKITVARRTVAQLEGSLAEATAQAAQVRAKISETELQILEIEQNVRTEAGKDLRDQQVKAAELSERRISAEDQLKRIDIRAPQAGIVHQSSVHTVGGVIGPVEQLMLVVPKDERLVVEAKIAPQSIDQIRLGAPARIRFSAFDHRTTPEFKAKVARVSADLVTEQQPGKSVGAQVATPAVAAFYTVRLELADAAPLKDLKLVPGMPAEVHITTEERTAMSFMMKPLSDQFHRAFRER
ncbi:MAG: HlyD family type I secretion periplasmic adaptor subunit, partial [Hyphomicrobiales bacterium]